MSLLVLASSFLCTSARADQAAEARFFYGLGRRAFEAGRLDTALAQFVNAYTAAPNPRIAFNIGACAELTGREEMAFTYYSRYLATSVHTGGDTHERAATSMQRLRARLRVLEVRSEPSGALIYVDEIGLGTVGVAPVLVVLAPGEHRIIARLSDHAEASIDVAREDAAEQVTLRLQPHTGRLRVEASPVGATLVVSRREDELFRGPSVRDLELPIGRYTVRVQALDHEPTSRSVEVAWDRRETVTVRARPMPSRTSMLLVSSGGVDAEVLLDGSAVGRTPLRAPGLTPGRHSVEVRAPNRRPWRRSISLEPGDALLLRVTLSER